MKATALSTTLHKAKVSVGIMQSREKTLNTSFLMESSSLPIVVALSDYRLANRTAKGLSCVGVVDIRRMSGSYENKDKKSVNDCNELEKSAHEPITPQRKVSTAITSLNYSQNNSLICFSNIKVTLQIKHCVLRVNL